MSIKQQIRDVFQELRGSKSVKQDKKRKSDDVRVEPKVNGVNYAAASQGADISRSSVFNHEVGGDGVLRSSIYSFDLSSTWYMKVPKVLLFFVRVLFLPIIGLYYLIDMLVSLIVLTVLGSVVLWGSGFIEDEAVIKFFTDIGDRGLEIVRALGVPI